jgi:hypothetical protein
VRAEAHAFLLVQRLFEQRAEDRRFDLASIARGGCVKFGCLFRLKPESLRLYAALDRLLDGIGELHPSPPKSALTSVRVSMGPT